MDSGSRLHGQRTHGAACQQYQKQDGIEASHAFLIRCATAEVSHVIAKYFGDSIRLKTR